MHGSKQQTDDDRIGAALAKLRRLLEMSSGISNYHGVVGITVTYHNGQIVGYDTTVEDRTRFDCEKPRSGRQLVDRQP